MRKSLMIALLVLVGAAMAGPAAAQSCWQYHNVKLDFREWVEIDSGPYDFCQETKTVGTLNGVYRACWYWADFRSSDSIYGDGWEQIEVGYYDSWIVTDKGSLELREWSWFDGDFGVETGFTKVIGGTGAFEGAIGTLSYTPRFPALGGIWPLKGYVCTP